MEKILKMALLVLVIKALCFTTISADSGQDETLRFQSDNQPNIPDGDSGPLHLDHPYSHKPDVVDDEDVTWRSPTPDTDYKTECQTETGNNTYWASVSSCDNDQTGVDISVGWCPKLIRNSTIYNKIYVRTNEFNLTKHLAVGNGSAQLIAWIPGFDPPIFNRTFNGSCEHLLDQLPDNVKGFIKCPFNFSEISGFAALIKTRKGFPITNPLPTILPAGSYHIKIKVWDDKHRYFFCVDAWLDFGM